MVSEDHPPEDKELPLKEHIRELRVRIVRVLAFLAIFFALLYPISDDIIFRLWYEVFPRSIDIVAYSPAEWIVSRLIISLLLSILIVFPYMVYETYMFLRPGLFYHERDFLKTLIPLSYLLFLFGISLGYFVIIPRVLVFVIGHSGGITPELSVQKTIMGIFRILFALGLTFQIPIPIVLAVRLGLVTSMWLKKRRLVVYGILAFLATTISPDFTGLNQLIIIGVVGLLYEISIRIAVLFERGRDKNNIDEETEGVPHGEAH